MRSTLAAFVLALCWLAAIAILIFMGVRKMTASSKAKSVLKPGKASGFIHLGFALAAGLLPIAAWKLAEASTDWIDTDNDGLLDGFVAGQYDMFDFVLPSAVLWALALAAVLTIAYLAVRRVGGPGDSQLGESD